MHVGSKTLAFLTWAVSFMLSLVLWFFFLNFNFLSLLTNCPETTCFTVHVVGVPEPNLSYQMKCQPNLSAWIYLKFSSIICCTNFIVRCSVANSVHKAIFNIHCSFECIVFGVTTFIPWSFTIFLFFELLANVAL